MLIQLSKSAVILLNLANPSPHLRSMQNNLANPYYYLDNFRFVLTWVAQRYGDLLSADESRFVEQFPALPISSQALLVRMVMRRGNFFRVSKLRYPEIGDTLAVAQPLIALHWLALDSVVTVQQLYGLLTKQEFALAMLLDASKSVKKVQLLDMVNGAADQERRFGDWIRHDSLLEVRNADLVDRFRLMFFGNLHQDWSEFVLSDLGIYRYEQVAFPPEARAFQNRADIDIYLQLHACRERLQQGEDLDRLAAELAAINCVNPWLHSRREKLLFQLAQEYERVAEYAAACDIYASCAHGGARIRHIRALEKLDQVAQAYAAAQQLAEAPHSAEERQQLARLLPRLLRKLGQSVARVKSNAAPERIDLVVPYCADGTRVEELVRQHIEMLNETQGDTLNETPSRCAPVFYVENTLINSLFGLLCWEAIFHPVPGAFFHPFQFGPADLHSANFFARRAELFQQALAQLATNLYRQTILDTFARKNGIQSPFVFWGSIDAALLTLALDCIPAAHLRQYFERILDAIAANRSGFPDLIQFWPQQRRYRMIEVKGPGDRLQDNQMRFLEFCAEHQMPVAVCYVEWQT